ncbi:MAG: ATP-grasp domain-containing protein [Tunicatimonas sp.]|uniref:ATP-grasp domain-containing protein n=1 Tax=Tunicatimonas sp. TaxID=1940096 RepID=UPI003C74CE11
MLRVLITGGRNPSALELVRLLKSSQSKIWLADSLAFPVGRYSRHIEGYLQTPPVAQNPAAYIKYLKDAIKQHQIDLVIPSYEETFFIAQYRSQLENLCTMFVDDFDKLISFHHKFRFAEAVKDFDITIPPTQLINSPKDIKRFSETSSDYVFKPAYSRFATHTLICPSFYQLKQLSKQAHYPWVAQAYVEGQEICSYSIVVNGEVAAHTAYEHPYKLGQGSGIYYRAIRHPSIEQFVREFCRKHQYHGQIGFDFIQTLSGKIYVIECNPRTVNGVHLFDKKDHLLRSFLGTNTETIRPNSNEPRVNLLTFLTYNLALSIRDGQVRQWFQDLFKAKDVIFKWDDPLPMLGQNLTLLEFCRNSVLHHLPLADALSYDIAWTSDSADEVTLQDVA